MINSVTRAVKSPPSGPAPVILMCGKSFLVPSGTTSEEAKVNPEAPEIMVFPIDVLIVPLFEPPTISTSLLPCDVFAESIKEGLLWSVTTPVEAT